MKPYLDYDWSYMDSKDGNKDKDNDKDNNKD
jgi:hypothetical protein